MKKASEIRHGDRVKVHIYDTNGREIITRNHDKVFLVTPAGIPWQENCEPVPLSHFVDNINFVSFEIVKEA